MGNTLYLSHLPQPTSLPSPIKSRSHQGRSAKVYVSFIELAFDEAHIDMSKPLDERKRERILRRCASMRTEGNLATMQRIYTLKRVRSGTG
jgi:hypothetical protein